jgi:uncharacterized protein
MHMVEIFSILAIFLPFLLILWVANLAEHKRQNEEPYAALALVAYFSLGAAYLAGLAVGFMIQVAGFMMAQPGSIAVFENGDPLPQIPMEIESLPMVGLGLWIPSLVGLILLLPPVRRWLARFIPINPESPVHAVAVALSMMVFINLFMTLGVGLGNLAEMMAIAQDESRGEGTIALLWAQQILMAVTAVVGVGWLARRSFGESLARLGVVVPTLRQGLIGAGLGVGMVPVVMGLEFVSTLLGLGADPDVEQLTEQLIGPLFRSLPGLLTLGFSAALGEETIFRGAMLPRFGMIATALLFALVHSNYGITFSTAIVFLLGLLLGWVRYRYNTSTAMVLHAVYNMTLGLLAYLSLSYLEF